MELTLNAAGLEFQTGRLMAPVSGQIYFWRLCSGAGVFSISVPEKI